MKKDTVGAVVGISAVALGCVFLTAAATNTSKSDRMCETVEIVPVDDIKNMRPSSNPCFVYTLVEKEPANL